MTVYTIATYGTLKRGKRNSLERYDGAEFVGTDSILNAQLWVNRDVPVWPIITPGENEVAVDVWSVTVPLFNWLKRGEEANHYESKNVVLKSGRSAWTWWYDNASSMWRPASAY